MELNSLRTLGRSGLPVSPLALGTMTFGNKAWGATDEGSQAIFNAYVDAGGNFIDTADVYAGGCSEELVGGFIAERKLRDRVVLATKFSFNGGNGRKNMYRAIEGSLRRLGTDYIDLYWMHVWDQVTPAEEMLQSLNDLVRAGKIRYFGLSDMPAWYTARMATLAQAHSVPGPIAMQLAYSLVERTIEQEYVAAAREFGMGITPWSPLGFGLLTGKYKRGEDGKPGGGGGRLDKDNPGYPKVTEQQWKTVDVLRSLSVETGKSMPQLALAWVLSRPGVTSPILGATKLEQLQANLASLAIELSAEDAAKLDEVSALAPMNPYSIFAKQIRKNIFGGSNVDGWS